MKQKVRCAGRNDKRNGETEMQDKNIFYYDRKMDDSIDFEKYIAGHVGDKTVAYKVVNGSGVNLSYFYPYDFGKAGETGKKYSTFIMIHGGGWGGHTIFDGETEWNGDQFGYMARYYAEKGMLAISIDYRLTRESGQVPDYGVAECADDCNDAVDYILDRAEEDHIDLENVFVIGESAGGHLTAMVATTYRREGFRFKAAFPVNCVVDMLNDYRWSAMVAGETSHPALKGLSMVDRAKYVSPLYRLDENVCPIILLHGNKDNITYLWHAEAFKAALDRMNIPCELHVIRETNHAFMLAEYYPQHRDACSVGLHIINDYLTRVGAL